MRGGGQTERDPAPELVAGAVLWVDLSPERGDGALQAGESLPLNTPRGRHSGPGAFEPQFPHSSSGRG